MKIFTTPTHYILNPDCHIIIPEIADFLCVAYKSMPKDKKVAFDLSIVETCSNKFLMMFKNLYKEREIEIINANQGILVSLYLMKYDRFVKIYSNDLDMFESKREIINRRFSLVTV